MTDRQALSKARSIDIHAHAVLAGSMGTAGIHGPEIGYTEAGDPWFRVGDYRLDGVRYEGSPFMESAVRLANMDDADKAKMRGRITDFLGSGNGRRTVAFLNSARRKSQYYEAARDARGELPSLTLIDTVGPVGPTDGAVQQN